MKTQAAIYIGFLASCAAFPVGLLRLWQHDPWPWCAIFGTLALVTIGLAAWSLVPRRPRTADQILAYLAQADGPRYALSMVNAGIGARGSAQHEVGAGPHPVRRATLLAPLALLLPRGAPAAALPAPRQWPRLTGPTDPPLSQALGHAWQEPGIDRAVVMVRRGGAWTWKGWKTGRAPGGVLIYEPHSVAPRHGVLGQGEVPNFGPHDLDREYDLADLRADARSMHFEIALINASLDGHPPWFCLGDESHFTPGLKVALRFGGTAEQVLAFAASAKQWTKILACMRPGIDVLALMRAAMAAPIDDAALLKRRRENHECHACAWHENAPRRADRVAAVMAVLRGGAA